MGCNLGVPQQTVHKISVPIQKTQSQSSIRKFVDENISAASIPAFWDERSSKNITVTKDGSSVTKVTDTNTMDIIRSTDGQISGIHVYSVNWSVRLRGQDSAVMGISCKVSGNLPREVFGGFEVVMGWDLISNKSIFNNAIMSKYPLEIDSNYKVPDNFVMILDLYNGVLLFKVENRHLGVCCRDLDTAFGNRGIKLYPTIAMKSIGSQVTMFKMNTSWMNILNDVISYMVPILSFSDLSRKWTKVNIMMKTGRTKYADSIQLMILQLESCCRLIKRVKGAHAVFLNMLLKFDGGETLMAYFKYTWDNFHMEKSKANCIVMSSFIQNNCENNSMFPSAIARQGCLDLIHNVLEKGNNERAVEDIEAKKSVFTFILRILYNFSKVSKLADEIRDRDLRVYLEDYPDFQRYDLGVSFLKVMALGRILPDKKFWKIEESILDLLLEQIKSTIKSKTIFEGIVFYLQEILECLSYTLECIENCIYMIHNGLIDFLLEILCHKLTGEINVKFTITCLNTILSVIITDKSLQESEKGKLQQGKIREKLQDLSKNEINGLAESAEICLIKIWSIDSYQFASEACLLENDCKKFIDDVLLISGEHINKEFTECHCRFCHSTRNFKEYCYQGIPPRAYSVPIGWYLLGLKTHSRILNEDILKKYHRAYHGTRVGNISKILRQGDIVSSPSNLDNSKKRSFDRSGETAKERVFISPSLRYAGLDAFAESYVWNNKIVKVAFDLLVCPGTYELGKEVVGSNSPFDSKFSNDEIEWSINLKGMAVIRGLLIKLIDKQETLEN
ncbi:DgyrCDS4915 [Dimorphilus gyrociliatus]|uniref:DgyrCDS4915 n=1 Tax=Dimorphilus gyrociliatus TaxID=2664684 RepID=A0A7I8VIG5_9ANNE|nr:DgyrCDS4915 [Dimorphilus gyrociliatus]